MSFLTLEHAGTSQSGKTNIWIVKHTGGTLLGEIKWWAAWRKYTFFPFAGTLYDPVCLREIAELTEKKTQEHKQ